MGNKMAVCPACLKEYPVESLSECASCGELFCGLEACPTTCLCDGLRHLGSHSSIPASVETIFDLYLRRTTKRAVFVTDENGRILCTRDAESLAQEYIPLTPEEFIGKTAFDLFDLKSAQRFAAFHFETLRRMKPREKVMEVSTLWGKKLLIYMQKVPVELGTGKKVVVTMLHDIKKLGICRN